MLNVFFFFFYGKKNYVLNHIGGNQENLFCDVLFPEGIFFFLPCVQPS